MSLFNLFCSVGWPAARLKMVTICIYPSPSFDLRCWWLPPSFDLLLTATAQDHCPEQTFFCSPTRSKLEEKHHFSGAYATAPPQTICLSRPVLVVRISKSRHVSSQFLQNEIRLNSSKQETTSSPVIEKVWSAWHAQELTLVWGCGKTDSDMQCHCLICFVL